MRRSRRFWFSLELGRFVSLVPAPPCSMKQKVLLYMWSVESLLLVGQTPLNSAIFIIAILGHPSLFGSGRRLSSSGVMVGWGFGPALLIPLFRMNERLNPPTSTPRSKREKWKRLDFPIRGWALSSHLHLLLLHQVLCVSYVPSLLITTEGSDMDTLMHARGTVQPRRPKGWDMMGHEKLGEWGYSSAPHIHLLTL